MRRDPLGRVKGMGGSLAGRMRCERKGRTDSRGSTFMRSAGIGEDGRRGDRT